jgi:hypothetical protein
MRAIEAYASDRALAWVDDLITEQARGWADSRAQPAFLVAIDPAVGLARADDETLKIWADSV